MRAQTYFSTGSGILYKITVNNSQCNCNYDQLSTTIPFYPNGISFLPDTTLVISEVPSIFNVDTLNGGLIPVYTQSNPGQPHFTTLLGIGDGIFYSMNFYDDKLYRININTDEITLLGSTGYDALGDITLYNGSIYYPYLNGIVLLDTNNTANSFPIVSYPDNYIFLALTASHVCNSLIGIGGFFGLDDRKISLINLADGAITHLCLLPVGLEDLSTLTSMLEFSTSPPCNIQLDLDCNDSSGATGADFNSPSYNCLSNGVIIADEDITMEYDAIITTMTVSVSGTVPDVPYEILISTGSIAGIDVDGSGTDMITLTNAGGARSTDFKDALRLIRYQNIATPLTPGPRTVEVMFTTESGAESNVAIAFIDVIESPVTEVDLGPDVQHCEGQSATFDAAHPGASYSWSTGSHNNTITVDDSGQYSVTVSDGINCPNADTVELEILPLIHIALTGDTEICDNETANLSIETNTPFGLTIDVDVDPGSTFHFLDVTGDLDFIDLINQSTTYIITNVTPIQDACLDITDSIQIIDVYPAYIQDVSVSLCDGDSIWLGYFWESNAGIYENLLESIYGCDSMVTTHITILPAVQIAQQSTTCDPSQTGVIITHLDNPIGCDTVVTTTITLLPSDTTMITLSSCSIAHTGITFDTLVNQLGCDSLIITTTTYAPPADSTYLYAETCDSTQIGVVYNITASINGCDSIIITNTTYALLDTTYLFATSCDSAMIGVMNDTTTGADGCDSLVITTTTFALADTTHLNVTSCDPSQVGISQQTITGQDGCDSLIITTTTFALADTTYLNAASCDPSQVGVSQHSTTGTDGCDSLVITTTTLLPSDAVSLFSTTCDPAQAGVYIHALTNQHGCDSVVTESITLLPSDAIFLSSTTCIASEAGVFVTTLTNQHGCDSIITSTVTLLPGDTTSFVFNTCDPALVGSTETIYTGQDGCDSLVIAVTGLYPLPQLTLQSVFDYNGFDISCIGDADGGAMAIITGIPPYTYLWSTSATEAQITGISAGDYAVTITDSNGCTTDAVITLHQPTELTMGFEVTAPDCFDQALGIIRIQATGGVPPYTYAKDGGAVQASNEFDALGDGIYQFTVIDANGCSIAEIISIDVPLMISVDLGSDQSISLGDTTDIHAIVNLPLDSISHIVWSGIDTSSCVNCLHQIVAPIITTAYSITVSSVDGCSDRDTMTVSVTTDQHLYIPNIFSPNGDGVNDILRISADDGVQEISIMEIYDRWGNLVFGFTHKSPHDPAAQWDGLFRGERMNPGVFTYKAIIVYVTGETEVRYGDVTLIR